MNFGKDFLWGAASAAYQVEGAWDIDGKGESIWDEFVRIPGKTFEGTNGDIAVDHYHRYKEDVKLMSEMGLKSYRFSISWPRILPQGRGEVNQKGIQFYNNLIDELLKYNIIPFITLYHWDLPLALQNEGGWLNRDTTDAFRDYAHICYQAFGDRVKHWITFNEAIVFIFSGYINQSHPPAVSNAHQAYQVSHHVNIAHAKAVKAFRKTNINGEIGITHVLSPSYPATPCDADKKAAYHAECESLYWFYDPILLGQYPRDHLDFVQQEYGLLDISTDDMQLLKEAKSDFIGINYYQRGIYQAHDGVGKRDFDRESSTGGGENVSYCGRYRRVQPKNLHYTKWMWEIFPDALYDGMQRIKDRYGDIAIYITENGLGDIDPIIKGDIIDDARIEYIEDHLKACKRAISAGIKLKGYFAWSFTDLLSWLNGFKKQYGFVYVDHNQNLARKKKKSFYWYQHIIKSHGDEL